MEIREKLIGIFTIGMQVLANEYTLVIGKNEDSIGLNNYGGGLSINAYGRNISINVDRDSIKSKRKFWSSWFNHQDCIVTYKIWAENYSFPLTEDEYYNIKKSIKEAKLKDSENLFNKIYSQLNG